MSHKDHEKKPKPVTKRKKGEPEDSIRLSTLRWWVLSIEKAGMEVVTTDPEQFLNIRRILAAALREINGLVPRPSDDAAEVAQSRTRSAPSQMMMSEGAACDVDADCGNPNFECCDGICVPKNACNIA
jgi:hypothetical protein